MIRELIARPLPEQAGQAGRTPFSAAAEVVDEDAE